MMERQGKGWFQPVVREHLRDVKGRLLAAAICTLLLAGRRSSSPLAAENHF